MNATAALSDEGLTIFLFHGVVESSPYSVRNYTHKHLGRDTFADLLSHLSRTGRPLSMDDVVGHHGSAEAFPPRAFAVTFDDGFENNYSVAAPLLSDFRVPATFYVTTGFVEHNAMSWIDRIEYCLEISPPGTVRWPWDDSVHRFDSTVERISLLDYLRSRVKRDASIEVEALVAEVFEQCGVPEIEQSDDPLDRKLSWKQVEELAADELFDIGGHSHWHRVLALLSPAELDDEIRTSVDLCRRRVDLSLRHYSYPEGLDFSYSQNVIEVLRGQGIVCCPTAEAGVNHCGDSLFRLKRVAVVPETVGRQQGRVPSCAV